MLMSAASSVSGSGMVPLRVLSALRVRRRCDWLRGRAVRWDRRAAGFPVRTVAPRPAVLVLSTPNTHVVAPMTPVCGGLHGARGVPTGAQARGPFKGCLGPFRCARDGYVHGFTSRIASRFAVVRCKTCAGLSPIPHLACTLIVTSGSMPRLAFRP